MRFCANCGAPVDGRFCATCGQPAGAGLPPLPNAPPHAAAPRGAPAAGLTENAAAACCYLLFAVTGVAFLVLPPYNQNRVIRFHAFQSILLTVAWVFVWTFMGIVVSILGLYSLYGFSRLIGLAFFVLWVYLMVNSYQGKKIVLPGIGPIAERQA
jgi:uncharacterized membrane protein